MVGEPLSSNDTGVVQQYKVTHIMMKKVTQNNARYRNNGVKQWMTNIRNDGLGG
jgi:hypothetical protein